MSISAELGERIQGWAKDAVSKPVLPDLFNIWADVSIEEAHALPPSLLQRVGRASIQFLPNELLSLGDTDFICLKTMLTEAVFDEIDKQKVLVGNMAELSLDFDVQSPRHVLHHEVEHLNCMSSPFNNLSGIILVLCGQRVGEAIEYELCGVAMEGKFSSCTEEALCASAPTYLSDGDIQMARCRAKETNDRDFIKLIEDRIAARGKY